jgi:hypothetical protein
VAFLTVSLAVACGTSAHEPMSSRLAPDMEGDRVGGGDVKPRLFEECERAEGGAGGQERQQCEIV